MNILSEMIAIDPRLKIPPNGIESDPRSEWFKKFKNNMYIPTKNEINIGYCNGFIRLEHEIAHILEVKDNNKLLKPDFGFSLFDYKDNKIRSKKDRNLPYFSHIGFNHFIVGVAVESRVLAIESIITGNPLSQDILTKGRLYNEMWAFICKELVKTQTKFKNTQDVSDWSIHIIKKTMENWNQDKVMHVWNQKMNYVFDWMES